MWRSDLSRPWATKIGKRAASEICVFQKQLIFGNSFSSSGTDTLAAKSLQGRASALRAQDMYHHFKLHPVACDFFSHQGHIMRVWTFLAKQRQNPRTAPRESLERRFYLMNSRMRRIFPDRQANLKTFVKQRPQNEVLGGHYEINIVVSKKGRSTPVPCSEWCNSVVPQTFLCAARSRAPNVCFSFMNASAYHQLQLYAD